MLHDKKVQITFLLKRAVRPVANPPALGLNFIWPSSETKPLIGKTIRNNNQTHNTSFANENYINNICSANRNIIS
jgi:hypothetical protein